MRVHHLINIEHGLDNLKRQRIKVSRFSELNDPFELLAIDIRNKDLRAGIRARKTLVNNKEGLISFSKEWRNPVLWSHYGDKHRGICSLNQNELLSLLGLRHVLNLWAHGESNP